MDRNTFSIIIPVIGQEPRFEDTLASVLNTQPTNSQIIVPHDGTYADPYDLKREVTFVKSGDGSSDLAALLNASIQVARHSIVAIFLPGVEASENWSNLVAKAFAQNQNIGLVAVPITHQHRKQVLVAGGIMAGMGANRKLVGCRCKLRKRKATRLQPLGPLLWASFFRTSSLKKIGPLCRKMDALYLDTDIALALRSLGFQCQWLPDVVVSTAFADTILDEARKPHGRSAQRALRRHGLNHSIGQRLISAALEALQSPLKPSMLRHALGRLLAGHRKTDAAFRDHISKLTNEHVSVSLPPSPDTLGQSAEIRRAA